MNKRYLIPTGLFLLVLVGITLYPRQPGSTANVAPKRQAPAGVSVAVVENQVKPIFVSDQLKDSPIPTNRIWSGVPTTGELAGLYPYPFAAMTHEGRLVVGKPQKTVTASVVAAQITTDMLAITGPDAIKTVVVEEFSDLTVTLSFKNAENASQFRATFTQGSPYIFIYPDSETLTLNPGGKYSLEDEERYIFSGADNKIAVFTNAEVTANSQELNLAFEGAESPFLTLAIYAQPEDYDTVATHAQNFVTSVYADYSLGSETADTRFHFAYDGDVTQRTTLLGLLPHQYHWNEFNFVTSSLDTLRGTMQFTTVEEAIDLSVPKLPMLTQLPMSNQADFTAVNNALDTEVESLNIGHQGSYFAGKELARYATQLLIARQTGNEAVVSKLQEHMRTIFQDWFTYSKRESGRYFAFDSTFGGLVAQVPEFDSQSFNDHHFHYGYFIYAASILKEADSSTTPQNMDFIELIIKDIANTDRSSELSPYMRHFDFYEGHSWASGFKLPNDGNNQESTSEAINAWYSIWRWGVVTKNDELQTLGSYLYSQEVNSAKFYWLNRYPEHGILPAEYEHPTVSLVWGGKFEYSTFFSPDPLAVNGIEYLPFTAGSAYLFDTEFIDRDVATISSELADISKNWRDINLMYAELSPHISQLNSIDFNTLKIDDGNSLSNILYWQSFWGDITDLQPTFAEGQLVYEVTNSQVGKYYLLTCTERMQAIATTALENACSD